MVIEVEPTLDHLKLRSVQIKGEHKRVTSKLCSINVVTIRFRKQSFNFTLINLLLRSFL